MYLENLGPSFLFNQDHQHPVTAPGKTQEMSTRFKGGVSDSGETNRALPSVLLQKLHPPNTWTGRTLAWQRHFQLGGLNQKNRQSSECLLHAGSLASESNVTQVQLRNYKGKNARSAGASKSYTGCPSSSSHFLSSLRCPLKIEP